MEKCIFCNKPTSFLYEAEGEYHHKYICPKCQKEKLNVNFNTGCSQKETCSIKLNRNKKSDDISNFEK
ncbi:MAG: hypothetical protein ACTSRZ_11915 [Promethearchaeota archaeon]